MHPFTLLSLSFPFDLPPRYTRRGVTVRWGLWSLRVLASVVAWALALALRSVALAVGVATGLVLLAVGLSAVLVAAAGLGLPLLVWHGAGLCWLRACRVASPTPLAVVLDAFPGRRGIRQ